MKSFWVDIDVYRLYDVRVGTPFVLILMYIGPIYDIRAAIPFDVTSNEMKFLESDELLLLLIVMFNFIHAFMLTYLDQDEEGGVGGGGAGGMEPYGIP